MGGATPVTGGQTSTGGTTHVSSTASAGGVCNSGGKAMSRADTKPGLVGPLDEFRTNRWIARTAPGWPGIAGAVWNSKNVSFENNSSRPALRLHDKAWNELVAD